jgi:hypothetical protein
MHCYKGSFQRLLRNLAHVSTLFDLSIKDLHGRRSLLNVPTFSTILVLQGCPHLLLMTTRHRLTLMPM